MIKETSKQALKDLELSGRAGVQRALILRFLITHNRKQGYTRKEIGKALNIGIEAITGRVNELVKLGLIDNSQKKVCSVTARYVEALLAS